MLMSQGARSAGAIGCPNRGASAALAALRQSTSAAATARLSRIDMTHLAVAIDPPALDQVAVLHRERRHIGSTSGRTAFGNECLSRRLHVARLVRRAALQGRRTSVPVPRSAEAGERLA